MESDSEASTDPRRAVAESAEQMAQELTRTANLPPKLDWKSFDFEVDPYDPYLDDLEAFLTDGRASREMISSLFAHSMTRHVTLAIRHKLLLEVERRLSGEVRIDVRQEGRTVLRALQHLTLPLTSMGLLWELYPRYVTVRLQERRLELEGEAEGRSAEQSALEDGLAAGQGDPGVLAKFGSAALPSLEHLLWGWVEKPPPDPAAARRLVAMAGDFPGRRAARMLTAALYSGAGADLAADVRAALARMPVPAREILFHHLTLRDPEPAVRRRLLAAAMELRDLRLVPLLVEDALGTGPWSAAGEDAAHFKELLALAAKSGDRRVVPIVLYIMSARPPRSELKEAILEAFGAGPAAEEFAKGRELLEAGRPVVVGRNTTQEEFLQRYGTFDRKMDPAALQAEIRRVSALWEACYHEEMDWRRPKDALTEAGPRERDLLGRLAQESRRALGRLQGHAQVQALEAEFKTKWMTTPQNDVSGKIPLAIILDERAARGADPEENRRDRETECADLYAMGMRAHEVKMSEDACRFAQAILQILPDHPFARDFLERLDRGSGIPGIDAGAEPVAGPSIILPG